MAETKTQEEPTLLTKRKPDLICEDKDLPIKTQKLQSVTPAAATTTTNNSPVTVEKNTENKAPDPFCNNSVSNSLIPEENINRDEAEANGEQYEEDDTDYDDEEDDDELLNGEAAVVDKKGKGILIEEEEDDDSDDDDDDSSDGGSELEGENSELEDDPLAEVDLDNILPSRTRRKAVQPGVYISNDLANNNDDSDDSDA